MTPTQVAFATARRYCITMQLLRFMRQPRLSDSAQIQSGAIIRCLRRYVAQALYPYLVKRVLTTDRSNRRSVCFRTTAQRYLGR
jgi:hypothetical protein